LKSRLVSIYQKLHSHFGQQHWWPGESSFEVIIGAILTQNTNWHNVEKAINNIKAARCMGPKKLNGLTNRKLAKLIRPAGYYNIKTRRLKNFLGFFIKSYGGSVERMSLVDSQSLREELLNVNGIGPETADSILLYALNKPVFVVDAYTKRILLRHKLIKEDSSYDTIQQLFMDNLIRDEKLFNEYHALLVRLGKDFCLKNNPRCKACPLE